MDLVQAATALGKQRRHLFLHNVKSVQLAPPLGLYCSQSPPPFYQLLFSILNGKIKNKSNSHSHRHHHQQQQQHRFRPQNMFAILRGALTDIHSPPIFFASHSKPLTCRYAFFLRFIINFFLNFTF